MLRAKKVRRSNTQFGDVFLGGGGKLYKVHFDVISVSVEVKDAVLYNLS